VKVFIVNDSGHNFDSAKKFGELVYMSRNMIDKYRTNDMYRTFTKFLKDSEPTDYILQSGPSIMNAIACSVFAVKHGRLNLLIWRIEDAAVDVYVSRKLIFHKEKEDEQD